MKKYIASLFFIVLLSFSASSLVATYTGELDKYGQNTVSYKIGYASEEEADIRINVSEVEGLNISYTRDHTFKPESAPRTIYRNGQDLPVEEFFIDITPKTDAEKVYSVPVTFEASKIVESSNGTASTVTQEREYILKYGFQGSREEKDNLLNINNQSTSLDNEVNGTGEKETASGNNSDRLKGKDENQENKRDITTLLLFLGVILIFGYTFYEVVS